MCAFPVLFLTIVVEENRAFRFVCASQKKPVAPSPKRVTS